MEEFLELSHRVSWHDAALGACFQLGLNDETIRCDPPICDFPLIELINLILFLNGSDCVVEEIPESRHPAPAGTRRVSPAYPMPRAPTYLSNDSYRLPNAKRPPFLQSSSILLSSEPPPTAKSRSPFAAHASLLPIAAHASPPPSAALPHPPPFAANASPPAVSVASPPAVRMASPPAEIMASPPAVRIASLPVAAHPSPVPAPRQRPPLPAPRQRPPEAAPHQRTPEPAPRQRTPEPAPRQHTPEPAPRQCIPRACSSPVHPRARSSPVHPRPRFSPVHPRARSSTAPASASPSKAHTWPCTERLCCTADGCPNRYLQHLAEPGSRPHMSQIHNNHTGTKEITCVLSKRLPSHSTDSNHDEVL